STPSSRPHSSGSTSLWTTKLAGHPCLAPTNKSLAQINKSLRPYPKNASGPGNSVRDILIFAGGGLHRLMIASTVVPIIQWQMSMILSGENQHGKANLRLDASLLQ